MSESDSVSFDTREVVDLARVTPRQLQWWDERNFISPKQRGHRRHYSFDQVLAVMTVADLLRKGFSLQRCRTFIRQIQRGLGRRRNREYLITDGKKVSFAEADSVIDLATEATAGILVVSIADQISSVETYVARTSAPRTEVVLRRTVWAGGG